MGSDLKKSDLQKKIAKYKSLVEKGYIQKQEYNIDRLDTIGYNLSIYKD